MQLLAYTVVSTGLAGLAVTHAYLTHGRQFYPAAIHLAHSNAAVMAMMNMVVLSAVLVGTLLKRIFIGPLRVIEHEHLYERLWFSISESCLAMTIFREDFGSQFVTYFTFLLLVKTFHWLAMDRVDFMEQAPQMNRSFHSKMPVLMCLLFAVDVLMVHYAVSVTYASGPSMMLLFGFEFVILASNAVATFVKYVLHTIDQRSEAAWEEKSVYLFYLDLITEFIKLVTYTCFFVIILSHYGLPLHIIRDLYTTLQKFINRLRSFIQYRRAMANMNSRYPNATMAELQQTDRTCIICREDMDLSGQPKKLPCGHIFHFRCLRSWLERQQSCPTCRRTVLVPETAPTPRIVPLANRPPLGLAAGQAAPPPIHQQPIPQLPPVPRPDVAPNVPATAPPPAGSSAHVMPPLPHPPASSSSSSSSATLPTSAPHSPPSTTSMPTVPHMPGFRLIPLFNNHPASGDRSHLQQQRFPTEQVMPLLSDEQLRRMEGQLRDNVVERIRFLSGIQDEVSSMVVRLEQYLSLVDSQTATATGQVLPPPPSQASQPPQQQPQSP